MLVARQAMTGMTRASSTGALKSSVITSQLVGAPAYSFGKPKHRKGCFKIPVLDARSPEYMPGVTDAPGVGAYNIHDTLCRHDKKYGHPGCHRAPAFSWSSRTEPRDVTNPQPAYSSGNFSAMTLNRMTDLSHVRSDSYLDVPGPGAYLGQNPPGLRHAMPGKHQLDAPSYTMRKPCKPLENNPRFPPGPGPDAYDTRHKQKVCMNRQPAFILPKQKRVSEALLPKTGTDADIGPGRYEHATALYSKFSQEEARHHRDIALKF